MGVCIIQSKHMNVIKICHYAKNNAWCVVKRGFSSNFCPNEIKDKVSINDLDLLYWFPNLNVSDKSKLMISLNSYKVIGDWFKLEALDKIKDLIKDENKYLECKKEEALKTRRRL